MIVGFIDLMGWCIAIKVNGIQGFIKFVLRAFFFVKSYHIINACVYVCYIMTKSHTSNMLQQQEMIVTTNICFNNT